MHLLFDGQALQAPSARGRGIGRFAYNLLHGIRRVRPDWQVTFVQASHLVPADRRLIPPGLQSATFHPPYHVWRGLRQDRWRNDRAYADWLLEQGADALLTVNFFEAESVQPLFTDRRVPHFVVLHDLIPVIFPDPCLNDPGSTETYCDRLRQMFEAEVLLANSRCTARDYLTYMPEGPARVVTIGGSTDPAFGPLPPGEFERAAEGVRAKFSLSRPFILNGAGDCWRKNMRGALRAFAALPSEFRDQFDFVVACKIPASEERSLLALAEQLGVVDQVKLTGFVTDEEPRTLYQLCRVFLFPSKYEGLGLPIVEALRCGAPVVTSDCSSMPEYAGPVSFYANPLLPESLTEALLAALREPRELREAERVAFGQQFTWDRSAEIACEAIASVVEQRRREPRKLRPRVAWVSALSPDSCHAERSAALAQSLADRFAIEFVIPEEHPRIRPELNCHFPVIRANELELRNELAPYDLFLYHLEAGPSLPWATDLLRQRPGIAVFHDASAVLDDPNADPQFEGATGAVAFSPAAWTAVRTLLGLPSILLPEPMPLPLVADVATERKRFDLAPSHFVVGLLGTLTARKRPRVVLRALAALPPEVRHRARLVIAGSADEAMQEDLIELATSLGLEEQVSFLGRLPGPAFAAFATACDVCAFLRAPHDGEIPGALPVALAAGAVCVVSNHGAMAGLPLEAALRVRPGAAEVEDLTRVLTQVAQSSATGHSLREAAREYVGRHHSPRRIADLLTTFLTCGREATSLKRPALVAA